MTIIDLAMGALSILIPALVGIVIELIRRKLGLETMKRLQVEMESKKDLADSAVKFVEELYRAGNGDKKLAEAITWVTEELTKKGIKADENEIKGLVLSALKQIRGEFGEQWNSE